MSFTEKIQQDIVKETAVPVQWVRDVVNSSAFQRELVQAKIDAIIAEAEAWSDDPSDADEYQIRVELLRHLHLPNGLIAQRDAI